MNILFLRKRGSKSTCEGIVGRLRKHNVQCVLDGQFDELDETCEAPNVLIRWNDAQTELNAPFEINTADMVRLMNNKIETRRILIENNISVPKTYFSKDEAKNEILNGQVNFPLIGRRTHHSQGRHMKIIYSKKDLRRDASSTYWSEYVPKDREFRVFVFFGYILGICEKIPSDPEVIAWNNSVGNGIFETMKRENFPPDVALLALKAVHALNVDFGAVDIMSCGDNHYVLELNSGPTCSEYRQFLFGKAFKWLIKRIENEAGKPNYLSLPERVITYKDILLPSLLKKVERYGNGY